MSTKPNDIVAESWTVVKFQGAIRMEDVIIALMTSHSTGKLMLHFNQGRVLAAEWCQENKTERILLDKFGELGV